MNPTANFPAPFLPYDPGTHLMSVNTLLNMPPKFPNATWLANSATGVADLAPIREVYLHSSLADNRTLHVKAAETASPGYPST